MKRYSIFHAFILSFFSKSFYQDVGQRWRGTGLGYLVVLLALLWIPSMIHVQWGMSRFAQQEAPKYTQQIPAITISHGKVSTNVPTPYFIKDPDDGAPLAIIDTTGKYEDLDNTDAKILLTKSKIISKDNMRTQTYDLSSVQSFYLDRAKVENWLAIARRWFALAAYPVFLICSFIFRTIQVLVYALVGLLFAQMVKANLNYQTLMRLAAVALTPILILNLIVEFIPRRIPYWWLLGTCIGLGYVFFAVKSNSESTVAPEPAPTLYPTPML